LEADFFAESSQPVGGNSSAKQEGTPMTAWIIAFTLLLAAASTTTTNTDTTNPPNPIVQQPTDPGA
jgi:hypothetical protein